MMSRNSKFLSLVLLAVVSFSSIGLAEDKVETPKAHDEFRPITRPVSDLKNLNGKIVWKAAPNEDIATLIVPSEGGKPIEYQLQACNETCRAEVLKCKGNEQCEVRGQVTQGSDGKLYLNARTFKVLAHGKLEDPDFDKYFSFTEVKPGEFTMGSDPNGPEKEMRSNDEVPHKVKITKGFDIGKYDVTQSLWEKVMGSLPAELNKTENAKYKDPSKPIIFVSYNDITRKEIDPKTGKAGFIEELKKLRRKQGDNSEYELPSEAQWEYAARGGQKVTTEERQAPYSFGSNPKDLNDYAWNWDNSKDGIKAVGTKKANPLGLYDMHGNVWQWTRDSYIKDTSTLPAEDPVNLTEGSYRVIRGGSFYADAQNLRSAYRYFIGPDDRYGFIGFRLVRTPNQ